MVSLSLQMIFNEFEKKIPSIFLFEKTTMNFFTMRLVTVNVENLKNIFSFLNALSECTHNLEFIISYQLLFF